MKKYLFILIFVSLFISQKAFASGHVYFWKDNPPSITVLGNVMTIEVLANFTGVTQIPLSVKILVNNISTGTYPIDLEKKGLEVERRTFEIPLTPPEIFKDGTKITVKITDPIRTNEVEYVLEKKGEWFYSSNVMRSGQPEELKGGFLQFKTELLCQNSLGGALNASYESNYQVEKFTPCFMNTSGHVPTYAEFESKQEKEFGTLQSKTAHYYYVWENGVSSGSTNHGDWLRSKGYLKEADCTEASKPANNPPGKIFQTCTSSNKPPIKPTDWDTVVVKQNTSVPYNSDYKLLAPIGSLDVITKDKTVGDYLNIMFKVGIGLLIALSVIMLVIHGIQYMGDESVFGKTEAMHSIRATIGGLILALGAYAILNTINPDLVNGSLDIKKLVFNVESIPVTAEGNYRLSQANNATFTRIQYVYDRVKAFVALTDYSSYGYPNKISHCAIQAVVIRESGGNAALVGHDEDAPLTGIGSRSRFIKSGVKYSKAAFSSKSETDATFFNDDHIAPNIHTATNPSADDLGLDWRFSHGIGLMQITFFPADSNEPLKYNIPFKTAVTGTEMKLKDMFNFDQALKAGTELLQFNYKKCNGDIFKTYKAYGSGSCDSTNSTTIQEATIRKNLYDQCVAQDK